MVEAEMCTTEVLEAPSQQDQVKNLDIVVDVERDVNLFDFEMNLWNEIEI